MPPKAKAVKAEKSAKVEEKVSPVRTTRRAAVSPAKATNRKPSPSPVAKKVAAKKTVAKKEKVQAVSEVETEESSSPVKSVPLVSAKKSSSSNSSSSSPSKCAAVRYYLIAYNTLSALAWAFLLFNLAKSFFVDNPQNHRILFKKTGWYLAYLQSVAVLEILHAALRWVPSGVISNVIQIASRLLVIWVAGVYGGVGKHWAYAYMAVAWSLSDLTRYAYYLTQLTGCSVPALMWARYNFFLVLYPVGTLCEALLLFLTRHKMAKDLVLNYGLLVVLAIYTPGFLYMYSHMLHQRAKKCSTSSNQVEEKSSSATVSKRKVKSK